MATGRVSVPNWASALTSGVGFLRKCISENAVGPQSRHPWEAIVLTMLGSVVPVFVTPALVSLLHVPLACCHKFRQEYEPLTPTTHRSMNFNERKARRSIPFIPSSNMSHDSARQGIVADGSCVIV
jgi:hypothetical protein